MDITQVSNARTQNVHGRGHHHGGNLADMVNKMASGIDKAVEDGKLTGDQATALKDQLAAISEMLKSDPSGTGKGLSQDDRKDIRKAIHEIGKQLRTAMRSNTADATESGGLAEKLFKAIDTNNDKSIDKDELSSFIKSMSGDQSQASSGKSSFQLQISYSQTIQTSSTFSIMA